MKKETIVSDDNEKVSITLVKGNEQEIPIKEVVAGDFILVKTGQKIPVDGVVIEGYTSVDESILTGKSIPIEKQAGEQVIGGSINKNGTIKYQASKAGKDIALAQIIHPAEETYGTKVLIAKAADYFVPVVVGFVIIAALAWYVSGQRTSFFLKTLVSVLAIACPCTLGLAAPSAIMAGIKKGEKLGVFIKSKEALKNAHDLQIVILDKTGTITKGNPIVTDIEALIHISKDKLLQIAASAEKGSGHPLEEAIVKAADKERLDFLDVEHFKVLPGYGIEATMEGKEIILGNEKLIRKCGMIEKEAMEIAKKYVMEGKTPVFLAIEGKLAGIICVADIVKKSSKQAIVQLKKMGLNVVILTGDNQKTAQAIAKQVGIEAVYSEVLPEGKADEVRAFIKQGKKVAMVGDGINDAFALIMADVGIAIGSGTDAAMESADIILMRSDLMDVVTVIWLSRKIMLNIKKNLFWAFIYNAIGISVGMHVLYLYGGLSLHLVIVGAAMILSAVLIGSNVLRLKKCTKHLGKIVHINKRQS